MIQLKPQDKWPPLVGTDNIPLHILIRDIILTLSAWMLLGYLLFDLIHLTWDYLSHPIFELTVTTAPDWHKLWLQLRPYADEVALLTVWLMFWGIVRRKALSATTHQPQPPALTPEEHALNLKLNAPDLREWQSCRNQTVYFDENGNITKVALSTLH